MTTSEAAICLWSPGSEMCIDTNVSITSCCFLYKPSIRIDIPHFALSTANHTHTQTRARTLIRTLEHVSFMQCMFGGAAARNRAQSARARESELSIVFTLWRARRMPAAKSDSEAERNASAHALTICESKSGSRNGRTIDSRESHTHARRIKYMKCGARMVNHHTIYDHRRHTLVASVQTAIRVVDGTVHHVCVDA